MNSAGCTNTHKCNTKTGKYFSSFLVPGMVVCLLLIWRHAAPKFEANGWFFCDGISFENEQEAYGT